MKKFVMTAGIALGALLSSTGVSAQTAEIEALLAQIAALQAQIGTSTTSTSTSGSFVYAGGYLRVGSRGQQVMDLQKCLAELGNNPNSNIDGIFGSITKTAVMSFQASKGVAVDGIIGPVTGPLYTAECAKSTNPTDNDTNNPSNEEFTLGGEGEVTNFDIKTEDDAMASSKEQHIATIKFEVEDGDVVLEKIDLYFEEDTTVNDLWENIENITLLVDGDEIADADVSDKDEWKEHDDSANTGKDVYSISLKGNEVFEDGDEVEIEVMIETSDEVETVDADEDYNLWAELRFTNADDVLMYEGGDESDDADAIAFSVEPLSAFDLTFDEANNSPEDDDSIDLSSDEEATLVIVEAEVGDDQGGTLQDATVVLTLAGATIGDDVDELIDEVVFMIDGDEIDTDDSTYTLVAASEDITFTFDLDDYEVDAEDKFDIEIMVKFNELDDSSNFIGSTVTVKSIAIDGEDSLGDDFPTETETTSYAPVFKAIGGAVDINFNGDLELLYTADHAGTAKFEVSISNDTGADITVMDAVANWTLDINGLTTAGSNPTTVTDKDEVAIVALSDESIISDGETETYTVTVDFTGDSTKDASITIEEIGAEDIAVSATVSE